MDYATMQRERYKITTFGEYSHELLSVQKARREFNTREMYKYALAKFEQIDGFPFLLVTTNDLQRCINQYWEHPRTCKNMKLCIDQIYRRAVREGLINQLQNPADDLDYPFMPNSANSKRVLTETEERLLPGIRRTEQEHLRLLILMLQAFGLRLQEAVPLTAEQFDMDRLELTIDRAVYFDHNRPFIKCTKNNKIRVLPIPSSIVPEISERLGEMCEGDFFIQKEPREMLSKSYIADAFRRVGQRIADITFDEDPANAGMTSSMLRKQIRDIREAERQLQRYRENRRNEKIMCRAAGRFKTLTGTEIYADGRITLSKKKLDELSSRLHERRIEAEKRLPKTAGLTPYTFRHNYATKVLYYGGVAKGRISTKAAARMMGHSEQVFAKIYSHLITDFEQEEKVVNDCIRGL